VTHDEEVWRQDRKRTDNQMSMGRGLPFGERNSAYSNISTWGLGLRRETERK
jgi:hypothetical protein